MCSKIFTGNKSITSSLFVGYPCLPARHVLTVSCFKSCIILDDCWASFACLPNMYYQLFPILWDLACPSDTFSILFDKILFLYGSQVTFIVLLVIVLAGAALGYWIVRRFVISKEDGSVDAGVAEFVKWAMRIFGYTFIWQVCISM